MGHSLGSAPSVHIASKFFNKTSLIRAIILISPIASSFKFFEKDCNSNNNNIGLEKFDVFCNIKKIQEVNCPVFIIHGKKDDIIPVSQSEEMLKYVKIHYEWFPKNGDHINILTKYRMKFITKCKIFLNNLSCFERKKNGNVSKYSCDNSFGLMGKFGYNNSGKKHKNLFSCDSNNFNALENKKIINDITGSIVPFLFNNNTIGNINNCFEDSNYNASERRGSYKLFGLRSRAYENDLENISGENNDMEYDNYVNDRMSDLDNNMGNYISNNMKFDDDIYNNMIRKNFYGTDLSYGDFINMNAPQYFNNDNNQEISVRKSYLDCYNEEDFSSKYEDKISNEFNHENNMFRSSVQYNNNNGNNNQNDNYLRNRNRRSNTIKEHRKTIENGMLGNIELKHENNFRNSNNNHIINKNKFSEIVCKEKNNYLKKKEENGSDENRNINKTNNIFDINTDLKIIDECVYDSNHRNSYYMDKKSKKS